MLCHKFILILGFCLNINEINSQSGPDPWNSANDERLTPTLKTKTLDARSNGRGGIAEWSYRRLLAIILKHNQKKNNDHKIDIHLQMEFSPERWHILEDYLKSDEAFSEDMIRRTLGYVEEAIYKPTFIETMTMAWSDYVEVYLTMYKAHITWTLGIIGAVGVVLWLWNRMSQRCLLITVVVLLYFYEVFISYKETEQQEYQMFIKAVNTCKWYFWTDDCDVPLPDWPTFLKHMNPAKIAIKMITGWISEPLICMSTTINTIINGATGGMWFPFDVIVHGILTVVINIFLIMLFIMLIFSYIFNTPCNLGFLLCNISILQRHNTNSSTVSNNEAHHSLADTNRLGGATLDRFLEICSRVVETATATSHRTAAELPAVNNIPRIRRSASTGRLPNLIAINDEFRPLRNNVRQRHNFNIDGSGDS